MDLLEASAFGRHITVKIVRPPDETCKEITRKAEVSTLSNMTHWEVIGEPPPVAG